MHDAKNRELKEGDLALIPVRIKSLSAGETYCNVTVESVYGRRPDNQPEIISAINTGVLLRANAGDDASAVAQVHEDGTSIVVGGTDLCLKADAEIGGSGTNGGQKK